MALVGLGGVVEGFMERAWTRAVQMSDQANDRIDDAVALTTPAPQLATPQPVVALSLIHI